MILSRRAQLLLGILPSVALLCGAASSLATVRTTTVRLVDDSGQVRMVLDGNAEGDLPAVLSVFSPEGKPLFTLCFDTGWGTIALGPLDTESEESALYLQTGGDSAFAGHDPISFSGPKSGIGALGGEPKGFAWVTVEQFGDNSPTVFVTTRKSRDARLPPSMRRGAPAAPRDR
jgi:hypothetical protein